MFKMGKKKLQLTSGRYNVLDKDKYGLVCTELDPLTNNVNKLSNSQISRDKVSAARKTMLEPFDLVHAITYPKGIWSFR